MSSSASINKPLAIYLTPEAAAAAGALMAVGMDFDLAVAVIEQEWPEERIWDIPICPELEQKEKMIK